jgi:hypothetical protein
MRKEIEAVMFAEGREVIRIGATSNLRIPRPIHTILKTRQSVLVPAIGSGFTSGGSTQISYIGQTGATAEFGAMAFSLQDLDQVTSFTALFDQYRIDRVIVQIRTRNNALALNSVTAVNAEPPSLLFVIDRDDSTAPTLLAQLREYDNCQIMGCDQSAEIDLEPSVTPAVFASGSFSGYGSARTGMWLDCANTSIPHYGVKFGVSALNSSTTAAWYWDLYFWYFLSFRNVR